MYQYADRRHGYNEQDLPAFYYDESGKPLIFNVLFENKTNALKFQRFVLNDSTTSRYPIKRLRLAKELKIFQYLDLLVVQKAAI